MRPLRSAAPRRAHRARRHRPSHCGRTATARPAQRGDRLLVHNGETAVGGVRTDRLRPTLRFGAENSHQLSASTSVRRCSLPPTVRLLGACAGSSESAFTLFPDVINRHSQQASFSLGEHWWRVRTEKQGGGEVPIAAGCQLASVAWLAINAPGAPLAATTPLRHWRWRAGSDRVTCGVF